MKKHPIGSSFAFLLRRVADNGMFAVLAVAPLLFGGLFKYGLPWLYQAVPATAVLQPYGLLFDSLLYLLTPYMALYASAMVALEERDAGTCTALFVTPLRPAGYMVSRFLLPALAGAAYTAALGAVFSTVVRPLWHSLALALPAAAVGMAALLFIPAFARDKISGLAMGKLVGLVILTVLIPAFLPIKWQPALCWLPTYWFYRFLCWPDWLLGVLCLGVSALWCVTLYRVFRRKVR